jgi:hypothetical protein
VELAALFGVSQGQMVGTEAGGTEEGMETGEGSTEGLKADDRVMRPEWAATFARPTGTRSRASLSSKSKTVADGAASMGKKTSRESSIGSTKLWKARNRCHWRQGSSNLGDGENLDQKEWLSEQWHVENIDQPNSAATNGDLNGAMAFNEKVTVIGNTDKRALNWFKLGEGRAIIPHVGVGTAVNDGNNNGQKMLKCSGDLIVLGETLVT